MSFTKNRLVNRPNRPRDPAIRTFLKNIGIEWPEEEVQDEQEEESEEEGGETEDETDDEEDEENEGLPALEAPRVESTGNGGEHDGGEELFSCFIGTGMCWAFVKNIHQTGTFFVGYHTFTLYSCR